jgi:hypothetical protein
MVESGVDIFHQRDTLLRKLCDELLKRVIAEARAREGNDVNVQPKLSCQTVDYRGLPGT